MPAYPDPLRQRLRWLVTDLAVAAWAVTWILVGQAVGSLVLQLDSLAQGLVSAGKTFNGWLDSFERAIPNGIPFLSDFARHQLDLLKQNSGDPLIGLGHSASHEIYILAVVLAVVVATIPVALALVLYVPGRLRLLRDLRGVDRTVKLALRGPAGSENLTEAAMQFLAARALFGLPYPSLLRHSRNPVLDWQEGRYEDLARAELEHHGLSLERYFKTPPPGQEVVRR